MEPYVEWTITHAHFLQMGGFRLICSKEDKEKYDDKLVFHYELQDGTWEGVLTHSALMYFMEIGRLECPNISEEEIKDKSKGDAFFKALAILQLLWFILQVVVRASIHLDITPIEITTCALVVATIFMYWSWWNKPLNAQCPVFLRLSSPADEPAAEEATTPTESSDHVEAPNADAERPSEGHLFMMQNNNEMGASDPVIPIADIDDSRGGASDPVIPIVDIDDSPGRVHLNLQERSDENGCSGALTRLVDQLGFMGRLALTKMTRISIRKSLLFIARFIAWILLSILARFIFTVASIIDMLGSIINMLGYTFLWSIEAQCRFIEDSSYRLGSHSSLEDDPQINTFTILFTSNIRPDGIDKCGVFAIILSMSIFGGVHCAAWTYPFPTQVEQIIWRVMSCSIVVPLCVYVSSVVLGMILGLIILLTVGIVGLIPRQTTEDIRMRIRGMMEHLEPVRKACASILRLIRVHSMTFFALVFLVYLLAYAIARTSILVLSIASLRKLPPSALQTADWLNAIPHI